MTERSRDRVALQAEVKELEAKLGVAIHIESRPDLSAASGDLEPYLTVIISAATSAITAEVIAAVRRLIREWLAKRNLSEHRVKLYGPNGDVINLDEKDDKKNRLRA